MHVTYHGPFDAVEIDGLTAVTVKRGETIEVNDDFGAQLIEQSTWDAPPEQVLAWVGKDTDRAATLLRAEQDGAQRADVLGPLDRILNPPKRKPAAETAPAGKAGD